MKSLIYILLLSEIFLACKDNKYKSKIFNTAEPDIKSINIISTDNFLPWNKIVSGIQVIPLETNSSCLISSIDKLVYQNNQFYIQDIMNKSLLVYGNNGEFIFKIKRVGKGPGEFLDIRDFQVGNDGSIFILDFKKILKYNSNGEFLKNEIEFDYINTSGKGLYINPTQFAIVGKNSNKYYLWGGSLGINENSNYKDMYALYVMDKQENIKNRYFPLKHTIYGGQRFYSTTEGFNLRPIVGIEIIYKIQDAGLHPSFKINFGKYALPDHYFKEKFNIGRDVLNIMQETNYCISIDRINESSDFIYFSYIQGGKRKHAFYSKITNESFAGILNIFEDQTINWMTTIYKNNKLISIFQPQHIKAFMNSKEKEYINLIKKSSFEKINDTINDIHNPVLLIHELNEF